MTPLIRAIACSHNQIQCAALSMNVPTDCGTLVRTFIPNSQIWSLSSRSLVTRLLDEIEYSLENRYSGRVTR